MMHIVWNELDSEAIWQEGRDDFRPYLREMMGYLGFTCRIWNPEDWMKEKPKGVTLLVGGEGVSGWAAACSSYCSEGNALLAMGETYGLEDLLGVRKRGRMAEGWIVFGEDPLTEGLRSSFHCFDGILVDPAAYDVLVYGRWKQRNGTEHAHPAIALRGVGRGCAALIGFDLMKTFCLVQQGVPVYRDGTPAPDGSASIDEGILKVDDGAVLDWDADRDRLPGGTDRFYLHPVVDEMRILFARILHLLQEKTGMRAPQTWFWPDSLPAVGHISHDSDGNSPEMAEILLEKLAEAEIRSTWCNIMPGYPDRINRRIVEAGHEPALHFNALAAETPEGRWTERDFRDQLNGLQAQFPGSSIVSNKNHYFRWEGGTAFYAWCERAGIRMEQTRGGTKRGNKGFTSGTCHPFVPVSTPAERNRLFDVLVTPTLAWDPPGPINMQCTEEEAEAMLRRSLDVNGVAHFLFHPGNVAKSSDTRSVGDFLVELCRSGRRQGLEWWTSDEIGQWCSKRRQVRVETEDNEIRIFSPHPVRGLTLLLPLHVDEMPLLAGGPDGVIRSISRQIRFGRPFTEWILDLPAGTTQLTTAAPKIGREGDHP